MQIRIATALLLALLSVAAFVVVALSGSTSAIFEGRTAVYVTGGIFLALGLLLFAVAIWRRNASWSLQPNKARMTTLGLLLAALVNLGIGGYVVYTQWTSKAIQKVLRWILAGAVLITVIPLGIGHIAEGELGYERLDTNSGRSSSSDAAGVPEAKERPVQLAREFLKKNNIDSERVKAHIRSCRDELARSNIDTKQWEENGYFNDSADRIRAAIIMTNAMDLLEEHKKLDRAADYMVQQYVGSWSSGRSEGALDGIRFKPYNAEEFKNALMTSGAQLTSLDGQQLEELYKELKKYMADPARTPFYDEQSKREYIAKCMRILFAFTLYRHASPENYAEYEAYAQSNIFLVGALVYWGATDTEAFAIFAATQRKGSLYNADIAFWTALMMYISSKFAADPLAPTVVQQHSVSYMLMPQTLVHGQRIKDEPWTHHAILMYLKYGPLACVVSAFKLLQEARDKGYATFTEAASGETFAGLLFRESVAYFASLNADVEKMLRDEGQ